MNPLVDLLQRIDQCHTCRKPCEKCVIVILGQTPDVSCAPTPQICEWARQLDLSRDVVSPKQVMLLRMLFSLKNSATLLTHLVRDWCVPSPRPSCRDGLIALLRTVSVTESASFPFPYSELIQSWHSGAERQIQTQKADRRLRESLDRAQCECRRLQKRLDRANAHAANRIMHARDNCKRSIELCRLRKLSPELRLQKVADGEHRLPWYPVDFAAVDVQLLNCLTREQREKLQVRCAFMPKGAWRRLGDLLKAVQD